MNNDTRDFMKFAGTLVLTGIIGGFIGGIFGNYYSMVTMKPHHCNCHHRMKMMMNDWQNDFSRDFEKEKEFDMKMRKKIMKTINEFKKDMKNNDDYDKEIWEEEYIIIPKSFIDEITKNPKPFMGPKPNNKR